MATIIDALVVTLKLDNRGFSNEVKKATAENDKLSAAIDNVSDSSADLTITIKNQADETKKAAKKQDDFTKSINNGIKAIGALFATIMASSGLSKLISEIQKSNDQLYFLSKNLGMSATEIKKWQNMAEMSGGSADGMAASMSNLSKSLWDLVTIGDSSVLPYFNALNVGVVDSGGKLRDLDAILLDVADSLSGMSRPQAYNIAKNMGFDEGTINTLLQGRDAMQEMLDTQRGLVISSEEELEISRQLNKQNAKVRQGWEGLKTLLANYLMPSLLKFSEMVTGVLMFLNKNRDTAVSVFKGIGIVLGVLLIPMVIKAATAFLGMFAAIGLVPLALFALGAGLWLLYDDFKKWKAGGESLLGEYWKKWDSTITPIIKLLDKLADWFKTTTIGKWFTDQEGNLNKLEAAFAAFAAYIATKWAAKMLGAFGRVSKGASGIGKGLLSKAFIGALLYEPVESVMEAIVGKDNKDWLESHGLFWTSNGEFFFSEKDAERRQAELDKKNGARLTENTLDIPTGDSERDALAAKVSRGELSINEANDLLMSGYNPSLSSSLDEGASSDFTASGVDVPHWNKRIFKTENGDVKREGGSRSWRNNNPGNIEYGDFAKRFGAIGTDGRFAIFPTEEAGRKAKEYLIFESNGGRQLSTKGDYGAGLGYKDKTLSQMLTAYAPKEENITNGYIKSILSAVGVEKRMGDYTAEERDVILEAMKNVEGWDAGDETRAGQKKFDAGKLLAQLVSFNKQISQPLTPNAMPGIQQTMANSEMLQAGNKTVNNRVEANFGDININTSSPTISGGLTEATTTARESMFQLITPMS